MLRLYHNKNTIFLVIRTNVYQNKFFLSVFYFPRSDFYCSVNAMLMKISLVLHIKPKKSSRYIQVTHVDIFRYSIFPKTRWFLQYIYTWVRINLVHVKNIVAVWSIYTSVTSYDECCLAPYSRAHKNKFRIYANLRVSLINARFPLTYAGAPEGTNRFSSERRLEDNEKWPRIW